MKIESIVRLSELSILLFLATLLAFFPLFGQEFTDSLEPCPFTLDEASCVVHGHFLLNFFLFAFHFFLFFLSKLLTPQIILSYQPFRFLVVVLSLLAHALHTLLLSIHF
jgi:hypothetical protein